MKTTTIVCILASTLLLVVEAHRPPSFDFYVYDQQWPASMCSKAAVERRRCKIPRETYSWTIHGLWPSSARQSPSFCKPSKPFSMSKILSIERKMKTYWPSLFSDNMSGFWKHEWEKHGTCAVGQKYISDQLDYFKEGLDLNRRFNLLRILESNGIKPSNSKTYRLENIEASFYNSIGKRVHLQCFYDARKGVQYLLAAKICLNKMLDPIDCSSRHIYVIEKMEFANQIAQINEENGQNMEYTRLTARYSLKCDKLRKVTYNRIGNLPLSN